MMVLGAAGLTGADPTSGTAKIDVNIGLDGETNHRGKTGDYRGKHRRDTGKIPESTIAPSFTPRGSRLAMNGARTSGSV
jgi:hypothetical protein